jgi:hypothetical protein
VPVRAPSHGHRRFDRHHSHSRRASRATQTDPKTWKVPRTPWGAPDLQGVWTSTDLAATKLRSEDTTPRPLSPETGNSTGAGPSHWSEQQTPLTFKVAPMTPLGKVRAATPRLGNGSTMIGNFSGPEELGTWVRCLSRGMPGVMTPTAYNNNYQIVQSPIHIVVMAEMIHDARVIPLDGRPHAPSSIQQWLGDSRGRWQDETLVVDVTNLSDQASFYGSTGKLHLVERFTRTGPETLQYEVSLDDRDAWTEPWKFSLELTLDRGQDYPFEYACHETNYGLRNILTAGRALDAKAAEASAQQPPPK